MKPYKKQLFCTCVFFVIAVFKGQLSVAQEIPEIQKFLKDRERALSSYRVNVEINGFSRDGSSESKTRAVDRFIVSGKMVFCERHVWLNDEPASVYLSAFDGVVTSVMVGNINSWGVGEIEVGEGHIYLNSHPSNFLTSTAGHGLAETIDVVKPVLSVDGFLYRLEFSGITLENGTKSRLIVVLDKNLGFAPVRFDSQTLNNPNEDWVSYNTIEISGHREVAHGLFLPNSARTVSKDTSAEISRSSEYDFSFSNWDLRTPVQDSDFRVKFDPGIMILDKRVNKSYRATQLTNWKIQENLSRADQIQGRKYFVIGFSGLFATVLVVLIWRRFSSRT